MADIINAIKDRRSIRKFEDKNITEDLIYKILDSVKWAPSWANTQCWEIIVIKDNLIKENLKTTLSPVNPATKSLISAPIVLAVCGKLKKSGYYNGAITTKFGDWFMFDLGIVTQNICLTAHSFGLGTVIVGLFDHDKAKEILNINENYELAVMIPIGYPAKSPSAPKRREISEFTHHDKF